MVILNNKNTSIFFAGVFRRPHASLASQWSHRKHIPTLLMRCIHVLQWNFCTNKKALNSMTGQWWTLSSAWKPQLGNKISLGLMCLSLWYLGHPNVSRLRQGMFSFVSTSFSKTNSPLRGFPQGFSRGAGINLAWGCGYYSYPRARFCFCLEVLDPPIGSHHTTV